MRISVKLRLWAATLLALLFWGSLWYIGSRDLVKVEYANYKAAEAADAFKNEALPLWLPRSASNIRSVRNLDSNTEVVSFSFGADFEAFLSLQESAPAKSASDLGIR